MSNSILPEGWAETTLGNILTAVIVGGTPSRKVPAYFEGSIPWFTVKDMKSLKPNDAEEHISESAIADSATNLIPANTLIIATRIALGRAMRPTVACAINQDLKALLFGAGIDQDFILYWICANERTIQDLGSGTTVTGIRLETLHGLSLLLPPFAEQTRIVEKLEELLSDLDAAVSALKDAKKKLGQYRQSLLKSAVEGALTAEWRKRNGPSESGKALLERILIERRTRWEAKQLVQFKEQGKTPPKDWRNKYPEPVKPNTGELGELPEGWGWATLSQVGWLDRGRSKHRPRNAPHLYGGPYPFVQTGDIRHADTFLKGVEATYSESGLAQSRLWPVGTMCITIAANIGKTAILSMEACFPDSVVGFLSGSDNVSIRFVEYFMRTIQQKLEDEAPATAQKNINLEILGKVVIPVPPIQEQIKIVEILDGAFFAASNKSQSIDLALKQAAAQRKNVLKSAFTGQLVPQDSNDGPAAELLERIKAEREVFNRKSKPKYPAKKKAMKNIDINVIRKWVKLNNDFFTFDSLAAEFNVDYEVLKELVFQLLQEEAPVLIQRFSRDLQCMVFRAVNT